MKYFLSFVHSSLLIVGYIPELVTARQDGDNPVKEVTSQRNVLVLHLHLNILQVQSRVAAIHLKCALIDRTSSTLSRREKICQSFGLSHSHDVADHCFLSTAHAVKAPLTSEVRLDSLPRWRTSTILQYEVDSSECGPHTPCVSVHGTLATQHGRGSFVLAP